MRKYLVMMATIIVLVGAAQAQLIQGYGVKAGISSSNQIWSFEDNELSKNFDNKIGITAGVFAEFLPVPFFKIVTEANFVQKGTNTNIPFTTEDDMDGSSGKTIAYRIDYINFCVKAKASIPFALIKPYIFAGPRVDFQINTKTDQNLNHSMTDDFEKVIYGVSIGIGGEIKNLLPAALLAEFQYNHDLTNIDKTQQGVEMKNRSFEFRLGIKF
ncbi:MAG: PorT family protein [Calditrichia bacterium]|nr:PorT family protein [Calditrichia bacterium]